MVGQERTVLPLLATDVFGLTGFVSALTFVVAFGDRQGGHQPLRRRAGRPVRAQAGARRGLAGRAAGAAPDHPRPVWGWVVAANVLLGVNQGLTWSTTVIMKIDLVGPVRRGLATGINEAAGYGAVAFTALVTGWIAAAYGLRPGAVPPGAGLSRSSASARRSCSCARRAATSSTSRRGRAPRAAPPWREVFWRTTLRDRDLSAASQAGLVNNLNDGMAWGLLPLFYASAGLALGQIGVLAATYPAVWAVGQVATGGLSDRIGRKPLIVGGMLVQAGAIAAHRVRVELRSSGSSASALLGLGTAMVYPTLLAAIADVADPVWRASAIGSTGCGATWASRSARSSRGSSPTHSGCRRRSSRSRR